MGLSARRSFRGLIIDTMVAVQKPGFPVRRMTLPTYNCLVPTRSNDKMAQLNRSGREANKAGNSQQPVSATDPRFNGKRYLRNMKTVL